MHKKMKSKTVSTGYANGDVALTVSPSMNINGYEDGRPIVRVFLWFIAVFWHPPFIWIEEPGHGSWQRSYGFHIAFKSGWAHFSWNQNILRYRW